MNDSNVHSPDVGYSQICSSTHLRPRAVLLLDPVRGRRIYSREVCAALNEYVRLQPDFIAASQWSQHANTLAEAELVMSGWGAPCFDSALLQTMPKLRAVFYGAGSVKKIVSENFWKREIVLSSAADANAVPVAEYTVSQVFWLLKDGYRYGQAMRQKRGQVELWHMPGAYRSIVGLVSLSRIGRMVAQRLRSSDLEVVAYDPFATPEDAAQCGVRLVSLAELFRISNVVSLHAPLLPETEGMIGAELLSSMAQGAAFINTARGAIVDQEALAHTLLRRPDIFAVLDVTSPEPPPSSSPLYDLPNVVLTPHIAGSLYGECERIGWAMVEEVRRFVCSEPLRWQIAPQQMRFIA